MTLTLQIENMTNLPDGGPLSVSIKGERGLDIGRDPYLDWTLPDPNRFISGRHCEVRWHDGAYWLHDISTNGTFLNGADSRLKGPHRLRNGDRFVIGHYVIAATLDEEAIPRSEVAPTPSRSPDDLWGGITDAPAPIDRQQLKPLRQGAPVNPDFLDWAVDLPAAPRAAPVAIDRAEAMAGPPQLRRAADEDWAAGSPPPPPPTPEPPAVPSPRRIAGRDGGGAPVAAPPPVQPEREARADGAADFVAAVARGAELPPEVFAQADAVLLGEQLGRLVRLTAVHMRQLLEARQQAKRSARSTSQTTIQAVDNNPLKFAPTAEDALRIMFAPQGRGYLDAEKALLQGFDDLKTHQIRTYAAMQQAVRRLVEELDPAAIESASPADRGLAAMVGSRKARLWDIYVARWQAHAQQHDHGLLGAFMSYFARSYDSSS